MCLAIPGQVIELVDETNHIAKVEVAGVRRNVNVYRAPIHLFDR